jgi:hypothetical protein
MVYKIVSTSHDRHHGDEVNFEEIRTGSVNFGRNRTPEKKCRFQVKYRQKIYDVSDPQDQFWHTGKPKVDSRTGKPVQIHDPEIVEFENRSWIDEGYEFSGKTKNAR